MAIKKKAVRTKEQEVCCESEHRSMCGGTYGLAFIGAAVYYIKHAVTFWGGVVGVLKAMVWPALVMYKVLEFFKM